MTAKFLNNYPVKNAVRIISQNRKFAIVTCILWLLGIPLMLGAALTQGYLETLDSKNGTDYYYGFEAAPYIAIGAFCTGIAILLGMFCGIRAFEEEWNKTRVDMLYSLPLNGTQRFFSNYTGGFIMYAVPYIASVLLGWIVMLIMIPMIVSNADPSFAEEISDFYLYYFLGSVGLFVLMWMYYTISSVCASCCGTLFENIYTNLLLNVLIPGTLAAVLAVITENVTGLEFEYSWDFIGYTSPVGGLIYLLYLLIEKGIDFDTSEYRSTYQGYGGSSDGSSEKSGLIPAYIRWIIVIIVLTAALLVLAWKLYQRRKAEHVSKPFVYIWLYYLIITAVTLCILCISAADEDTLFAVILFSAIVYFIMEVIRKRGFKKFWLSIITYLVTVAIAISGYFLTIATDCFGRIKYIPPVGTVTSAEIKFEESALGNYSHIEYHLTYKDRDTISKIQDFQRSILRNHEELTNNVGNLCDEYHYFINYGTENYEEYEYTYYEDTYVNTSSFTVTYHTITGTSIHRSYFLYPDEALELAKIYAGTEAYAQAGSTLLKSRLTSETQKYDENTHSYYIPNNASFKINYFQNEETMADQIITFTGGADFVQTLADAYQADMQNVSFDILCKDKILGHIKNIPVYSSFTQTVSLLKEHGFTEFELSKILFENQTTAYNNNVMHIRIYAPENYRTASLNYPSYLPNASYSAMFCQPDNYAWCDSLMTFESAEFAEQYYPELYAFLNHARKHYISAEPCYLIVINGNSFLLPAEYSEEAKQIIALGKNHYSTLPQMSYSSRRQNSSQF